MKTNPVIIIGAGPVGLAAASHLVLRKQSFLLFEAGNKVASNILSWSHVRMFSPWRYNIDNAAKQLLSQTPWQSPDDHDLPTGQELYDRYLKPLSELPALHDNIFLNAKVLFVGRKNIDKMKTEGRQQKPFVVQVIRNNAIEQFEARAIIDTSGTWSSPSPIGSGGTYAIGEKETPEKIFYGIPDVLAKESNRYKNKNVLVVGSGHSSINAILGLNRLKVNYPDTEIHWVLRKTRIEDVYGGREKDGFAARGALGIQIEQLVNDNRVNVYAPFQIQQIIDGERLTIVGMQNGKQLALPNIDEIISNTGSRPDFSFLREVRLAIDSSLESVATIAELIDPNIHSCGTVRAHGESALRHPDKDFYIAGSKSYGRAPTFLLATGYEQVRSIAAAIDGDLEGAMRVELDLPETGVCSSDLSNSSCCGNNDASTQNKSATCCS